MTIEMRINRLEVQIGTLGRLFYGTKEWRKRIAKAETSGEGIDGQS